jgi:hypothetical protein
MSLITLRPRTDLNRRHMASEATALSTELRGHGKIFMTPIPECSALKEEARNLEPSWDIWSVVESLCLEAQKLRYSRGLDA